MSITETIIGENDVVALVQPFGGWPVGTEGAVVHVHPDFKLVEVANDHGETLDELAVTDGQLRLVRKYSPNRAD
jgi:hypothetical protein